MNESKKDNSTTTVSFFLTDFCLLLVAICIIGSFIDWFID